jgi:hypothetical protein
MMSLPIPAFLVAPGDVWHGRTVIAVRHTPTGVTLYLVWVHEHEPDEPQAVERRPEDRVTVSRFVP